MTDEFGISALLEPMRINQRNISNRIVMGPMAAASPEKDGSPSAQTIAFFERRARGGVGMIIVGGTVSTKRAYEESPVASVLRMDIDETIPHFRKVTDAVHAHGVAIISQLTAGFGRMGKPLGNRQLISPSPINVTIPEDQFPKGFIVPGGRSTPMPREATIAEIKAIEEEVIEAAMRARDAGFDGVQVAAQMSYFSASFLSPHSNWRNDEYGGSAENRGRFHANIVRGIRERAGPNFIIGLLLPANDYLPDGQGPQGFAQVAQEIEKAGLDFVALSNGAYETMKMSAPETDGAMIDSGDAKVFKKALKVPVMIQGVHDPVFAERAIREGHGDFVMLARQMLADPDYAIKLRDGRAAEIVKCDRQNLCMRRMVFGMPVRCGVNPEMGRESRANGGGRPIGRLVQAPLESVVLSLTGSPTVMGLVGKLATHTQGKRAE
ncbi:MAG: NADH:flavin oxidoreductase [Parvularculaceae bacterium]